MALWLGFGTSTTTARGSVPGLGPEIPYQASACLSQNIKIISFALGQANAIMIMIPAVSKMYI